MPSQITGDRLSTLFRPRGVALVGASDKSDAVVTWTRKEEH